eukprot:1180805-Prorocentrum_minimum.AAC.3
MYRNLRDAVSVLLSITLTLLSVNACCLWIDGTGRRSSPAVRWIDVARERGSNRRIGLVGEPCLPPNVLADPSSLLSGDSVEGFSHPGSSGNT